MENKMELHGNSSPAYAVIFISKLREGANGYAELAAEMVTLAQQQPGFLGFDSVRDGGGEGITVSYWESLEAIEAWRNQPHHLQAQHQGREAFYEAFTLHVTRVERSRHFTAL